MAALLAAALATLAAAGGASEATRCLCMDFPELPPAARPVELQRDLAYLEPEQQKQLEGLIEVPRELSQLPVRCAVCRLAALEAFTTAVKLGLDSGHRLQTAAVAEAQLGTTLRKLCPRLRAQGVLGVMDRRMRALRTACKELVAEPARLARLSALSGELAVAAATAAVGAATAAPLLAAGPLVDDVCTDACPADKPCGTGLTSWAALLEIILGCEPLGSALIADSSWAFPDPLADPLLFFSAAKSDVQAVRLIMALSSASPVRTQAPPTTVRFPGISTEKNCLCFQATLQTHGSQPTSLKALGAPLAKLMTKPSIKQQLQLLKMLMPHLFEGVSAASEMQTFVRVTSARLTMRIDDAVNDTAVHVAAYGYDHEGLLALLVRDGGGPHVDTADSLGRTALHYAADAQDQIAGLVNVFAEPSAGMTPVAAMRTTPVIPMAADHSQSAVVAALSAAQVATVQLLLVYGANPNAQAAVSGSSPLHLAARSGAAAVVEVLVRYGAQLESRNRHGSTPLILAAAGGHAETCTALLKLGARLDARDSQGRAASWYVGASASAMDPVAAQSIFSVTQPQPLGGTTATDAGSASVGGGWGEADDPSVFPGLNLSDPSAFGDGSSKFPDLTLCEVDRRPTGLPAAEFESDYLLASRPVLIQGGANHMPAKASWTRRAFFERAGHEVFKVQKLPMWKGDLLERSAGGLDVTLSDYYDELARAVHTRPLSWNGPRNQSLWGEMEAELVWPSSMKAPTVRRAGEGKGYFGLFMGPQGSGVTMHHHKSAWNALLFGRKLWVSTQPPHHNLIPRMSMISLCL